MRSILRRHSTIACSSAMQLEATAAHSQQRSSITLLDCEFEKTFPGHGGGCAFELSGVATLERCRSREITRAPEQGFTFAFELLIRCQQRVSSQRLCSCIESRNRRRDRRGVHRALDRSLHVASNAGGTGVEESTVRDLHRSPFPHDHAPTALGSAIACDGGGTATSRAAISRECRRRLCRLRRGCGGRGRNLQINPLFAISRRQRSTERHFRVPTRQQFLHALIGAEGEGCPVCGFRDHHHGAPALASWSMACPTFPEVFHGIWVPRIPLGRLLRSKRPRGSATSSRLGRTAVRSAQRANQRYVAPTLHRSIHHDASCDHECESGGSVTPPSGWFAKGSLVPIQATPDPEWFFAGWTGSGSGSYTDPIPAQRSP